ncbi:nucleoside monophosphate kinase [Candidatus Saccharibacteria bacterium]|nr:nucleoside monophosphate kinase [Candidatus Saccharibacteria bacterium]MCL1963156.1 nucleoside monophosphate kinase [Candidatus Saccharibacteria bacterium]
MIIFFGPTGSGKSMQGQILAARHGWRWLSSGQMFRDYADHEVFKIMKSGELVPDEITNKVVFKSLDKANTCGDVERVILDGYPRTVDQAKALTEHEQERCGKNGVSMCIVLEVPRDEIVRRLTKRGRLEDEPESVERRLQIHRSEIYPLLNFFNELEIPIVHIDGLGSVGEIHDRIETELESYGIVQTLDGDAK